MFSDPQAKRELEALLHPMIRAEAERRIAAAGGPYVIYVVPLLVESGEYGRRVERRVERDGGKLCRAQQRIAFDLSLCLA